MEKVIQGTRGRNEKEARPQTQWEWTVGISGQRGKALEEERSFRTLYANQLR